MSFVRNYAGPTEWKQRKSMTRDGFPPPIAPSLDVGVLFARRTPMAHILLIEDNAASAEPVAIFLRKRSHRVELAENGQQALYLILAGSTADVILLDLQMPVMDGIT